jgi:hypothetical protein
VRAFLFRSFDATLQDISLPYQHPGQVPTSSEWDQPYLGPESSGLALPYQAYLISLRTVPVPGPGSPARDRTISFRRPAGAGRFRRLTVALTCPGINPLQASLMTPGCFRYNTLLTPYIRICVHTYVCYLTYFLTHRQPRRGCKARRAFAHLKDPGKCLEAEYGIGIVGEL